MRSVAFRMSDEAVHGAVASGDVYVEFNHACKLQVVLSWRVERVSPLTAQGTNR